MLCPDEGDIMDPTRHDSGDKVSATANSLSDSYHVLMREIGVEQNEDDGISQAFIDKNRTAPRE